MAAFNSTPSYKSDDRMDGRTDGRRGTRVDADARLGPTDCGAVDLVSHIHCISIHPNPDYNILTSGTNGHLNLNGRTMRTICIFISPLTKTYHDVKRAWQDLYSLSTKSPWPRHILVVFRLACLRARLTFMSSELYFLVSPSRSEVAGRVTRCPPKLKPLSDAQGQTGTIPMHGPPSQSGATPATAPAPKCRWLSSSSSSSPPSSPLSRRTPS